MASSAFTVESPPVTPVQGAKAWGTFTVSAGVYTLQDSFNIASITKNAVGKITVTFTAPMASAFYAYSLASQSAGNNLWQTEIRNQVAGSFQMWTADATGFFVDPAAGSFIIFGN